jgi:hypothetical protein
VLSDLVLAVALRARQVADPYLDDRGRGDLDRALLGATHRERSELLAVADQTAQGARSLALLGALPPDHDALGSTDPRILQGIRRSGWYAAR